MSEQGDPHSADCWSDGRVRTAGEIEWERASATFDAPVPPEHVRTRLKLFDVVHWERSGSVERWFINGHAIVPHSAWDSDVYSGEYTPAIKLKGADFPVVPDEGWFLHVREDQLYFRAMDRVWRPLEGIIVEPNDLVSLQLEQPGGVLRVRVQRPVKDGEPILIADREIAEWRAPPDLNAPSEITFSPRSR